MESEKGVFSSAVVGNFMRPSWVVLVLFLLFTLITFVSLQLPAMTIFPVRVLSGSSKPGVSEDCRSCSGYFQGVAVRKIVMSIRDFGAVGDGKTSNTESFRKAIRYMQRFGDKGGSQLNIPKGRWLTGSFNLTSNFTLFLEEGAVILGSQVCSILSVLDVLLFSPQFSSGFFL